MMYSFVTSLAFSFLILVGVVLIVEGFDIHVPKSYIYFSMAFSVPVEMLNIRMRRKRAVPIKLHNRYAMSRGKEESYGKEIIYFSRSVRSMLIDTPQRTSLLQTSVLPHPSHVKSDVSHDDPRNLAL